MKTVLLGDVCEKITDGAHWSPKSTDSGFPMASVKDMSEDGINLTGCRKISEGDYKKLVDSGCKPLTNDILIAKDGSYLKELFVWRRSDLDVALLSSIAILKPDLSVVDPDFLVYYIKNQRDNYDLSQYVSGAAIPRIILKNFARMPIVLPDLPVQKKVTNILRRIDKKIELNRRMNETLEQIGQALFKHYFIDSPEAKTWPKGKVEDLVRVLSGFAFKGTSFDADGRFGLVTIKNVQDGAFVSACTDFLKELPPNMPDYCNLLSGDILLSLTGNVGRVCSVTGENLVLNQRVAKLEPAPQSNKAFVYFMFRRLEIKDKLISISRGTAQMNLSPVETKKLPIFIPPESVIREFGEVANGLYKNLVANNIENIDLIDLRDSLLPRLISGKL